MCACVHAVKRFYVKGKKGATVTGTIDEARKSDASLANVPVKTLILHNKSKQPCTKNFLINNHVTVHITSDQFNNINNLPCIYSKAQGKTKYHGFRNHMDGIMALPRDINITIIDTHSSESLYQINCVFLVSL